MKQSTTNRQAIFAKMITVRLTGKYVTEEEWLAAYESTPKEADQANDESTYITRRNP